MQQILLEAGQVLGIFIAVTTAITLIFGKAALIKIRAWGKGIWSAITYPLSGTKRELDKVKEKQDSLDKKLDFIVSQLSPNGGTSLRDAITRLEKHQRIAESKMAQYLDTKDAAIFETNELGLYTWVSRSYESLVGRPKSDLLKYGWTVAIVAEDLDAVRHEWSLAIEQKRIFESSYRIDKHGKIIRCKCKAIPAFFNDEVIAWTGILMEEPNASS